MVDEQMKRLKGELAVALNRGGMDTLTGTPDYILAELVINNLLSLKIALDKRAAWYGDDDGLHEQG